MERVTAFMVIFSMNLAIRSHPIENGFSVKFNPISANEDLKPKKFGSLFAKIPQDFKKEDEVRREFLTQTYLVGKAEGPSGFTNQVAKSIFPSKYLLSKNISQSWASQVKFINLPIVRQPYDEYKILVAAAPPHMHLGNDNKRMIVYVVLPEDGTESSGEYNIPNIYFVSEKSGKVQEATKSPVDPILIIDSNRTVTGLKSKEVSKYVTFKNKLSNRFNYKVKNVR